MKILKLSIIAISLFMTSCDNYFYSPNDKGVVVSIERDCNRDYLYWLLRETNINIDPELLGFDNPTPGVIYSLLKLSYDHNKDKFIYKEVHPVIYDVLGKL